MKIDHSSRSHSMGGERMFDQTRRSGDRSDSGAIVSAFILPRTKKSGKKSGKTDKTAATPSLPFPPPPPPPAAERKVNTNPFLARYPRSWRPVWVLLVHHVRITRHQLSIYPWESWRFTATATSWEGEGREGRGTPNLVPSPLKKGRITPPTVSHWG